MVRRRQVLVVAQNRKLASCLMSWLEATEHELSLVTTFAAAKLHIETGPDLVITELKLGDYNGLHLALWAQSAGIPAIVIGPEDVVLEKDAQALGATYVTSLQQEALVELAQTRLSEKPPAARRRFPAAINAARASEELMWVSGPQHAPVRRVLMN